MEKYVVKITPWIPLMIAAGYFLFLIMTWQSMLVNMKASDARFDAMLKKFERVASHPEPEGKDE